MKSSRGDVSPKPIQQAELESLHQEVDQVRNVMTYSIQQVLENSDNIEELSTKTHHLATSAKNFQRQAKTTRRQLCWNNYKYYCWGCSGAIVVVYLIGAWNCQSLTWNC